MKSALLALAIVVCALLVAVGLSYLWPVLFVIGIYQLVQDLIKERRQRRSAVES